MDVVVDLDSWRRAGFGGLLIGAAAALLLLANGRIAGISGVLGNLLFTPAAGDRLWRLLFIAGLLGGSALAGTVAADSALREVSASWGLTLLAGLLVGFGTRMGSGCTSGHGVCGIARGSARSIAATLTFMGAGFLTVFLVRQLGA